MYFITLLILYCAKFSAYIFILFFYSFAIFLRYIYAGSKFDYPSKFYISDSSKIKWSDLASSNFIGLDYFLSEKCDLGTCYSCSTSDKSDCYESLEAKAGCCFCLRLYSICYFYYYSLSYLSSCLSSSESSSSFLFFFGSKMLIPSSELSLLLFLWPSSS